MRHPNLFFSSSAQFVPQMVNSLNRIGLSPNCSIENRRLAVELAQLIISWEVRRCTNAGTKRAAEEANRSRGGGNHIQIGNDHAHPVRRSARSGGGSGRGPGSGPLRVTAGTASGNARR